MSDKFIPLFGYEIFYVLDEGDNEFVMPILGLYISTYKGMGTITGVLTKNGECPFSTYHGIRRTRTE